MKEDFIQNIQFDLFSVELVIGETVTLLLAENYVTIREVLVDGVKVEPNENKQIFLQSGGDDLWETGDGDILQPKDARTFTIKKASEVSPLAGNPDKFLNERGNFTIPILNHKGLTDKNQEAGFQHVDTTITKETLVNDDKVTIYDSVTGKIVLTNKSNVGGGSTDIISTNATNNTGTIVIDTTPNWQRVNISGGGSTLILDYVNGVLPNKNREYLLVINNATTSTIILTLPTLPFIKGGISYNFINSAVSVPIDSSKSIEVNVVFFFIDSTTCNVRTLISQFLKL